MKRTPAAITVEHLSKKYLISHHQQRAAYKTLRDALANGARRLGSHIGNVLKARGRAGVGTEEFWALKDISFEVPEGESVGIIGRNGAGKSTLLKILSRITEPTEGRARIRGRVASLLEVGTGFHPELTGRENVFLNGAILGMTKALIIKRFDDIVGFAGVEKFLDTPIKHYSSGMHVRLAFAVAAHLEPEILIVDEVLAVGDFEFQNRCLKKMENVARGGRTVLFVSHNMNAIHRLCSRVILLEQGAITMDGAPGPVIEVFLKAGATDVGEKSWTAGADAPAFDDGAVRLRGIRVLDEHGKVNTTFDVTESVTIEVEYDVEIERYSLNTHLYFTDASGQCLFVTTDAADSPWRDSTQPKGRYRSRVTIPGNLLNEGRIRVEYLICCRPHSGRHVTVADVVAFQIFDNRRAGAARGNWALEWPPSVVRPRLPWTIDSV
jgi:lipopolysaccharide transport system ATP-binding protein